jgi:hypothetical protein
VPTSLFVLAGESLPELIERGQIRAHIDPDPVIDLEDEVDPEPIVLGVELVAAEAPEPAELVQQVPGPVAE